MADVQNNEMVVMLLQRVDEKIDRLDDKIEHHTEQDFTQLNSIHVALGEIKPSIAAVEVLRKEVEHLKLFKSKMLGYVSGAALVSMLVGSAVAEPIKKFIIENLL